MHRRTLHPSLLAALGVCAALVAAPAAGQTVSGVVWDGVDGGPIAQARVTALAPDGTPLGPEVATDVGGRFQIDLTGLTGDLFVIAQKDGWATSAPHQVGGEAQASAGLLLEMRRVGARLEEVTLEEGGLTDDEAARVVGFVVDSDNGRGIPTAQVEVVGTDRRVTTDANGMFVLEGLAPGETALAISHLSYATSGRLFRARAGQAYELRAALAPEAIALEGIEVTTRSPSWYRRMEGLQFRMSRGLGGTFVLDTQLEARGYPPVAEVLRSLQGVRVRKANRFDYTVNFRNCEMPPVLFIDGIQVNQPELGAAMPELAAIPAMDVQAIEVYRGASTIPPEFAGPDAMCGAIAIWSKRGG